MRILNALAVVGGTLLLVVCLIAAGFEMVALPDGATQILGQTFANVDDSPYTKSALVDNGVRTKHYTFNTHDANEIADLIGDANADERRYLTPDAISHLDDVYKVVSVAQPLLVVAAILCVACLAHVGVRMGKRSLGTVLMVAGVITLLLFIGLGAWAAFGFNSLFAMFHSLFFAAGTWTFSYDSLLICMYPIEFWMGMAGIWLCVSVILSILCMILGTILRKR